MIFKKKKPWEEYVADFASRFENLLYVKKGKKVWIFGSNETDFEDSLANSLRGFVRVPFKKGTELEMIHFDGEKKNYSPEEQRENLGTHILEFDLIRRMSVDRDLNKLV